MALKFFNVGRQFCKRTLLYLTLEVGDWSNIPHLVNVSLFCNHLFVFDSRKFRSQQYFQNKEVFDVKFVYFLPQKPQLTYAHDGVIFGKTILSLVGFFSL